MSNERKGFIEVTDIDGIIFSDSKRNDFVVYSESSNQNILIGTQLSNVAAISVRSNNLHISNRVNIGGGSNVPAVALEVKTTDSILLPKGTTAQRPSAPLQGYVRYNTDINTFEGFGAGNAWGSLGGVKDTNQDTYISAESFPTSNDDNLVFYNSNIERMRITRPGYVGINTSNPQYLLHVNGQGYFGDDLTLNSNLAVNKSIIMQGLRVRKNTGGQVNFSPVSVPGVSNDSFGNLQLYSQNTLANLGIIFYTGFSNEVGRFTGNGKFSVGKSNPSAQLHINTPTHNDLLAAYSMSNINIVEIGDAASNSLSTDGTISLYNNSNKNVYLRSGGVSYITGGYVGIGTVTPSNTLDVNGNIGITNASIPMGLITEVGGTTPLLNLSVNFREPNKVIAYRGGGFRIDTRGSNIALFQWISRLATSNSDTQVMSLTDLGNLGIGTTSPGSRLHIYDSGSVTNSMIVQSSDSSNVGVLFRCRDGSMLTPNFDASRIETGWESTVAPYSGAYIKFQTHATGTSSFTNDLTIKGGNVGVGTTSPDKLLVVGGSPSTSSQIKINGSDGDKLYLTPYDNGSRIGHSTGWSLNFYAGQSNIGVNNGRFTFNNGSSAATYKEIVRFDESGYVGIGTSSPGYKLDVSGDFRVTGNWYWAPGANYILNPTGNNQEWSFDLMSQNTYSGCYWQVWSDKNSTILACRGDTGNVGVGTSSPGYKLEVSGAIYASGDITALSDSRFKEDLQPITNACDIVSKLQGYSYTRSDYEKIKEEKNTRHIGLIAQDVKDVLPEVVSYDEVNDKYGINYGSMAGLFVEGIKELKLKVDYLEMIVEKQNMIIQQLAKSV